MNEAQKEWKRLYSLLKHIGHGYGYRSSMDDVIREAALERALAAANRRIEEQAKNIIEVEASNRRLQELLNMANDALYHERM